MCKRRSPGWQLPSGPARADYLGKIMVELKTLDIEHTLHDRKPVHFCGVIAPERTKERTGL